MMQSDPGAIASHFAVPGKFLGAAPFGTGHIHDSFRTVFQQDGAEVRFLLQRINTHIFTRPVELMENVARVAGYLAQNPADQPGSKSRSLTLIPARDGRLWHVDAQGSYWRMYQFIEDAYALNAITSTAQAFEVARAFGAFQHQLATLPPPRLHETIPNFHNTPKRFSDLESAIAADVCNRAATARAEIEFAYARRPIASALLSAGLPERTTHNDTKYDNVLLDQHTGKAVCVVDLDTVMPGLAPYDFADMVRSMTSPAPEDEQDLARITMRFPVFEALTRGYLSSAGAFLTPAEKQCLPLAGKLITYENGLRFLSDYLAADTYYKVHRPGQNLDRCRTQFRLVESIEQQEEAMQRLVDSIE